MTSDRWCVRRGDNRPPCRGRSESGGGGGRVGGRLVRRSTTRPVETGSFFFFAFVSPLFSFFLPNDRKKNNEKNLVPRKFVCCTNDDFSSPLPKCPREKQTIIIVTLQYSRRCFRRIATVGFCGGLIACIQHKHYRPLLVLLNYHYYYQRTIYRYSEREKEEERNKQLYFFFVKILFFFFLLFFIFKYYILHYFFFVHDLLT